MNTSLPNPADPAAVRAWLADRQPDPDAVRQWATRRLPAAGRPGPVPAPGSPQWCALDDHDPRKALAVIHAALAWIADRTPEATADRLRAELDHGDQIRAALLKDMARDLSDAADWSRIASGPTARQLAQRRAQPSPLARPVDQNAARIWARTGTTPTNPLESAA